eukprot:6389327-Prorocentrum_lima.AAC.1
MPTQSWRRTFSLRAGRLRRQPAKARKCKGVRWWPRARRRGLGRLGGTSAQGRIIQPSIAATEGT